MPVLALLVPGLAIMNRRLSHKESDRTQPESFSDDDEVSSLPDEPIVYTDEELDAIFNAWDYDGSGTPHAPAHRRPWLVALAAALSL